MGITGRCRLQQRVPVVLNEPQMRETVPENALRMRGNGSRAPGGAGEPDHADSSLLGGALASGGSAGAGDFGSLHELADVPSCMKRGQVRRSGASGEPGDSRLKELVASLELLMLGLDRVDPVNDLQEVLLQRPRLSTAGSVSKMGACGGEPRESRLTLLVHAGRRRPIWRSHRHCGEGSSRAHRSHRSAHGHRRWASRGG